MSLTTGHMLYTWLEVRSHYGRACCLGEPQQGRRPSHEPTPERGDQELPQPSRAKERSLEENLARLREYREKDRRFQSALAAFVVSDASLEDPLEGTPLEGQLVDGQFRAAGPAQSRIRELLGA